MRSYGSHELGRGIWDDSVFRAWWSRFLNGESASDSEMAEVVREERTALAERMAAKSVEFRSEKPTGNVLAGTSGCNQ